MSYLTQKVTETVALSGLVFSRFTPRVRLHFYLDGWPETTLFACPNTDYEGMGEIYIYIKARLSGSKVSAPNITFIYPSIYFTM